MSNEPIHIEDLGLEGIGPGVCREVDQFSRQRHVAEMADATFGDNQARSLRSHIAAADAKRRRETGHHADSYKTRGACELRPSRIHADILAPPGAVDQELQLVPE